METPLIATEPDANILDSIRLMDRNGIGYPPVVENGTFVGILTVQDVLKAMTEFLETLPGREEVGRELGEATGEGACVLCGEMKDHLVEHDGRWICKECLDFLAFPKKLKKKELGLLENFLVASQNRLNF